MPRLIVVSNRLPFTLEQGDDGPGFAPSSGGLVSSLAAYLESARAADPEFDCLWVGWPGGEVASEHESAVRALARDRHSAHPVLLSTQEMELFYRGFCNDTIWPLFHYFPSHTIYEKEYWESYVRVNRTFCESVAALARPGDVIWIHDYQLMLLPGMLREYLPEASIGFFLHIPFPSHELFRLLPSPWRREILQGLLGADLIGFHTHEYTQHFLHCVFRTLGHDHHLGRIAVGDQARRADTFPISIDFDKFMKVARSVAVAEKRDELEAGLRGRAAIFSVDRLDYTKGILNRLNGFEEFLLRYPEFLEKVVFLLTVIPSREDVPSYQRMKQDLDERVGRINGRFGTMDWVPIVYQYRSLDFVTLSALYQLSPVALITPLRDGMNLVAKEYLASKPDGSGVLILSEMAGAARELGEAIQINPNHVTEIADGLNQGLTMPLEEQVKRNLPMQERLRAYDARRWATHFLTTLTRVKAEQGALATKHVTPEVRRELANAFGAAKAPLLLLDYDGTLVPFAPQPNLAAPDPALKDLIARLAARSRERTYLISGRDRHTLGTWFSDVDVHLIAEHGAFRRRHGDAWQLLKPVASSWQERITPILSMYVDRVAGSLLEKKEFSVAWHYRRCDPELGAQRAKELVDELTQFTANFEVQVLEGKKVVEVRNSGINKGAAALHVMAELDPDFVLAIGDDQTDEDLFRALPRDAISIRVGAPYSHAHYSVKDFAQVRELLESLVTPA